MAKKARVVPLAGKVMVITFFDYRGMVYQHEVPLQIITWQYYMKVLKTLVEHICQKHPQLHPSRWCLHHDNSPPFKVSNVVAQHLARQHIKCVPHPPYSLELAPRGFFVSSSEIRATGQVFQAHQQSFWGRWRQFWKECQKTGSSKSSRTTKHVEQKYIQCDGEYSEKEHTNLDPA